MIELLPCLSHGRARKLIFFSFPFFRVFKGNFCPFFLGLMNVFFLHPPSVLVLGSFSRLLFPHPPKFPFFRSHLLFNRFRPLSFPPYLPALFPNIQKRPCLLSTMPLSRFAINRFPFHFLLLKGSVSPSSTINNGVQFFLHYTLS